MVAQQADPWTDVTITGIGSVVVQGMILFPIGSAPLSRVVVRAANGRSRLLSAGQRGDEGTAAVLPGDLLAVLGGRDAHIQYRPAKWRDVIRFKPMVKVQLGLAILTLIAAVMAAITSYVGTRSPSTPAFTAEAAPWVLLIALVLAVWKLYSDIQGDLK
jgi:hypothetical protein